MLKALPGIIAPCTAVNDNFSVRYRVMPRMHVYKHCDDASSLVCCRIKSSINEQRSHDVREQYQFLTTGSRISQQKPRSEGVVVYNSSLQTNNASE